MEDDSRVSIVNDVNNCTKSSRCDAPLPLFRATDISRNGRVICSMSKLFIVSFHHPYTEDMVQIRIVNSTSSPHDSDSFRARMANRREAWNFINYSSFVEQMNNYLGCVLQWTRKWKSFSFIFCDIKHANILFQILEKLIRDWWRGLSTNWIHQRLIN